MDNLNWPMVLEFAKTVGVPFLTLLVIVGPVAYIIFTLARKHGDTLIQSHVEFMQSATKTQEKNADTLAKLEGTVADQQYAHQNTHEALRLGAAAIADTIDGRPDQAKEKLRRFDDVLRPATAR